MMKNILLFLLMAYATYAQADYAVALGDTPKYPPNFTHFEYANPNAPKGGTATFPMTGGFDSLNPFTLKGEHEVGISMLTLDTLMTQSDDEAFSLYGLIADDIRLSDDGLSVAFHINEKARFHNGDPVLAEDIVFSFKTLTEDYLATPFYRLYWGGVKKITAVDKHTVRFDFKEKNAELHLILGQLPVFSHKSFPNGLKDGNAVPIGSGAYRLKRTANGRLSEFERDKNYWAKDLPSRKGAFNFDIIRFKYYLDETARVEALKAGEYDILQESVARLWARAYSDKILKKQKFIRKTFPHHNNAGMQGFVMNLRRPILQDETLRRALVLAFDFETVNRMSFYGLYTRDDSFFTNTELAAKRLPEKQELQILQSVKEYLPADIFTTPPISPPTTHPEKGVRPNLIEARNLLLNAGYQYKNGVLVDENGKKIELEFLTYTKAFERTTAKWRRDLQKIGITLNIRVTDTALFQRRSNDFDYDIIIANYANSLSPGNEQIEYHSCVAAKTKGTRNYAGVCDPAVEKILPHFLSAQNRAELVAASRALDRVLRRKYIVVPNWYSKNNLMIYKQNFRQPEILPQQFSGIQWEIQYWWVE